MSKIVIFIITIRLVFAENGCVRHDFGEASFVCSCNSTYCDFTPNPETPTGQNFIWYTTNKDKDRLKRTNGTFTTSSGPTDVIITINPNKKYQKMIGFGGAFTDANGINMANLSKDTQNVIMKTYFSPDGSNYNMGRIPIAGTDFSTREYTYDDVEGDTKLDKFALTEEDYRYKIPLLRQALNLNPDILYFASPWTAPPWMKSNDDYIGFGSLNPEYYQTYADYFLKFLKDYYNNGIKIWAVSTTNEPTNVWAPFIRINTMLWTPENLARWIAKYLGPTLAQNGFNDTAIIAIEEQRYVYPWFVQDMKLINPKSFDYIKYFGLHWYFDDVLPPDVLDQTRNLFPDKPLLMTESCTGERPSDKHKVRLGSWYRATRMAKKLIQNFNHWIVAWVDWNLVLDKNGTPNWAKNFVDASIIVEPVNDTFYKQPQYYIFTHFSKFIPRGADRINWESNDPKLQVTAFRTDDRIIIYLFNDNEKKRVTIDDTTRKSQVINIELSANSLNTIIYGVK